MTEATKVAVLDDYQQRAAEYADWQSLGLEVDFYSEPIPNDVLTEALRDYQVLVIMRERTAFPKAVLEQLPNLKLLITTGMRNASVDVEYLKQRGIPVSGTELAPQSAGLPSTAELAWALIFAVKKRVTLENAAIRKGNWQTGMPTNLAGATLGLAGLGKLGSSMVGPAKAFGMQVIAWSEHLTDERAAAAGAKKVTKDELLARSDVLSIHLVLSDRTRGLIGAGELAKMKSTAVLVNTSRAQIVDEKALAAALRDGKIAGAGLDVYRTEPLPASNELTGLDNAVLLPHLGYVSEGAFREMYSQAVEDIAAWLKGSPIRTL